MAVYFAPDLNTHQSSQRIKFQALDLLKPLLTPPVIQFYTCRLVIFLLCLSFSHTFSLLCSISLNFYKCTNRIPGPVRKFLQQSSCPLSPTIFTYHRSNKKRNRKSRNRNRNWSNRNIGRINFITSRFNLKMVRKQCFLP